MQIPNRVGNQTWTADNLCIESEHEGIRYYTPRWDALCPYIDVTSEMLISAKKPFIVYALPPDSDYGVPISDNYGLVDTQSECFWSDERRIRKFSQFDKYFKNFKYSEALIHGSTLSVQDLYDLGGDHFASCEISEGEIAGFVDYVQNLNVLVLQIHNEAGERVFSDVSILLPEYNQIYGSFCQWDRTYKNKSPGLYACLLACRWARANGYQYYNLGPVGDYEYKNLFVTDLEPIYALALTSMQHPLALDPTSPLNTDFSAEDLNKLYRDKVMPAAPSFSHADVTPLRRQLQAS